jgi:hypothetical protein
MSARSLCAHAKPSSRLAPPPNNTVTNSPSKKDGGVVPDVATNLLGCSVKSMYSTVGAFA